MKQKKLANLLLVVVLAITLLVASACNLLPSLHTHTYSDGWTNDEINHWHSATCEHANEVSGKQSHTFDNGICTVCGYEQGTVPHTHTFAETWTSDADSHWHSATCEHTNEVSDKANHDFVDGKCSVCGRTQSNSGYQPSDGYTWSDDRQYIYFGEYPQSEVTDEILVASLNTQAGVLPTSENSQQWTDYGYYLAGEVQSYMWYVDLVLNGARYRGVYFTDYRLYFTENYDYTGTQYTYQDDNGYYPNTVYWFKYEPIRWRVLSQTDGTALLMCDSIIDSQAYQNSWYCVDDYYYYTTSNNAPQGTYANNYQYSTIRSWLNNDFYNTAFSAVSQQLILTAEVDNSASTTDREDNIYACDNTNDKVFLLSWKDILNSDYGFSNDYHEYDLARQLKTSAYAQSQGAATYTEEMFESDRLSESYRDYIGNGVWRLRSPGAPYYGNFVGGVGYDGHAGYYGRNVSNTNLGVVPALQIRL